MHVPPVAPPALTAAPTVMGLVSHGDGPKRVVTMQTVSLCADARAAKTVAPGAPAVSPRTAPGMPAALPAGSVLHTERGTSCKL